MAKTTDEVKGEFYTIKGRAEETDCNHCGCPLYNGDRAFHSKEDDRIYCGRTCAKSATIK